MADFQGGILPSTKGRNRVDAVDGFLLDIPGKPLHVLAESESEMLNIGYTSAPLYP